MRWISEDRLAEMGGTTTANAGVVQNMGRRPPPARYYDPRKDPRPRYRPKWIEDLLGWLPGGSRVS